MHGYIFQYLAHSSPGNWLVTGIMNEGEVAYPGFIVEFLNIWSGKWGYRIWLFSGRRPPEWCVWTLLIESVKGCHCSGCFLSSFNHVSVWSQSGLASHPNRAVCTIAALLCVCLIFWGATAVLMSFRWLCSIQSYTSMLCHLSGSASFHGFCGCMLLMTEFISSLQSVVHYTMYLQQKI